MQTVMTTNNGYDTILLVDSNDVVKSAWTATPDIVSTYLSEGANASEWETGSFPSTAEECENIGDYGTECGRDGVIANASRAEFWIR